MDIRELKDRLVNRSRRFGPAMIVAVLAATAGFYGMRSSSAASYVAQAEVEAGTITGNASKQDDQVGASGTSSVLFHAAAPNPNPPAPPPPSPGARPDITNTGVPAGTVLSNYSGAAYNNTSNMTYENMTFTSSMTFAGNSVTLRNCKLNSGVLFNGDNIRMERCEIDGGVSLSGTATVDLLYNRIHSFGSDGLHITSDTGQVRDVTVAHNYIHNPTPGAGAHADGVQVRGVQRLTFLNNSIDMGPWKLVNGQNVLNAAMFLQGGANGGNSDVTLENNYLNGGGYIFYVGNGPRTKVINTRFGPDGEFGYVNNTAGQGDIIQWTGNVRDDNGAPVNP